MDRATKVFWTLIALLLCASLFYGTQAARQRRALQSTEGKLETGDIVRLVRVIDGDTVVVLKEGSGEATVRILGIKAFNAKVEKDAVTSFGQSAIESLQRFMGDRPVRVLLNTYPKDRYGRYLATLYADDQDVGLRLVRDGLAMVYSVYPFPSMALYQHEQELAREGARGLWANREATSRAVALFREWQGQAR